MEPLWTDPRSFESDEGDVLPLEIMTHPVQPHPDPTEYMMAPVPDSELEGPVQRNVRKALAEQALSLQTETTTEQNDSLNSETLDPATAMKLVHDKVGFYARDTREQASLQAIVGRSDATSNPTVRYLYDVQRRSISLKMQDPSSAPHSIVRHFEKYAVQADVEARYTRFLLRAMHNQSAGPDQTIKDILSDEDYSNDAQTRRTLTSIVRLIEADRFAEEGEGKYPLAVRHGVDSLEGKDRDSYVLSVINVLPLRSVMAYNERLRIEENKRFEYWRSQLVTATMFSSVRAQAYESIATLDALRPRSTS